MEKPVEERLAELIAEAAAAAPLVAGFDQAIAIDADGAMDFEATAARADRMMRSTLGTSPRQLRDERMRATIRSEVAAGVAASMRRHGLVPACDVPADDDPEPTE